MQDAKWFVVGDLLLHASGKPGFRNKLPGGTSSRTIPEDAGIPPALVQPP
jgi:hypothetical protein